MGINKLWFDEEDEEKYKSIFAVVDQIETNTGWRFDQFVLYAKYYLNRDIRSLQPNGLTGPEASLSFNAKLTYNVVKMAIDAICAKIAKQKPRILFLTSEGNYDQQERAKNLTRYCDAVFEDNSLYMQGHKVFLDATIYGTGVFHVYADPSDKKKPVKIERVPIKDILVDEVEAHDGNPEQLHVRKYIPRHKLKKMFPKFKEQIDSAKEADHQDLTLSDRVIVIESWKLPSIPGGDDGVHCICLDNATLFCEPYNKDSFPFAFIRWSDPLIGFYGESLVYEIMDIQDQLTKCLETITIGQSMMAVPRWFVNANTTLDEGELNDLIGAIVRYEGANPPIAGTAPGASPELYTMARELFAKAFEVAGVSLLSATSQKPAGIESGKAMMVYADIETERFNLVGQAYQQLFLDVASLVIDVSKDMFGAKTKVRLRDKDKFVSHALWKDVDMDADKFQMSKYSTNFLPKEPTGQLQTVIDMVKAKMVGPEEAMALLDYPDTGHFYRKATAPLAIAEKIVNNILMKNEYTQPEEYMELELLAKVAQNRYLEAIAGSVDDVPEENLELLRNFMDQVAEMIKAKQPAPAESPMPEPPMPPMPMPE